MGTPGATAIAKVEVIPLAVPQPLADQCEGPVETLLVRITDAAGRVGIGECDSPPLAVKAFIEMPTRSIWRHNMIALLEGRDPRDAAALWQALYEGTASPGRRGLAIHALSAIDIALHDLAGKQSEVPVHRLLGGARTDKLAAYATIFVGKPRDGSMISYMKAIETKAEKALALGFQAIKIEMLLEEASDISLASAIADARRIVGDDVVLMIDFGYRWRDWQEARTTLNRIAKHNIYFAEAPLQHDDLQGHSRLSAASPIRICGGEWAVTRWEIRDWITVGRVSVVQPDPSRCGGITEMRRIADLCEMHGVQCIPHAWRTPILTMACLHLQAACPNIPYIECMEPRLYPSPLSDDLFSTNVAVHNGLLPVPTLHGLGLEISEDYIARYSGGLI